MNSDIKTWIRWVLAAYGISLTIKGTATLQGVLLFLGFFGVLWRARANWNWVWREAWWLLWPVLMFSVWVWLTSFFADSTKVQQPFYSLNLWRRDIFQPMVAMLCAYLTFRGEEDKDHLFWIQAGFIVCVSALALFQYAYGCPTPNIYDGNALIFMKGTFAMRGFSMDIIFFSYVLYLLTPGAIYLFLKFVPREKWSRKTLLCVATFVLLLAIVFLNKRRGTWLALGVEMFFILWLCGRKYWIPFVLSVLILVPITYHLRPGWYVRDYDRSTTDRPNEDRMSIWKTSIEQVKRHPWMGTGFGKNAIVKNYMGSIYQHAHNQWINTALGVGLIGLVLWGGVLWAYIWRFWKTRDMLESRIGLAFVLGFCVRNFFDDVWVASNAEQFWLMTGVFLASVRRGGSSDHQVS